MKLQQLKFIWEVAQHDLNVSLTAQALFTSQPGISKQIRLLEDELGVDIFIRNGKHLADVTPAGEVILGLAGAVLRHIESIKRAAQEFSDEAVGALIIGATHTQARYVLPPLVKDFVKLYPLVNMEIRQGTPLEITRMTQDGETDFAIATGSLSNEPDLIALPCFRWNRSLIMPRKHPLVGKAHLTLEDIAEHPIITYGKGFTGRTAFDQAFRDNALEPHIVCSATDADVIKTYVRSGLGIGVIACMAYDKIQDSDLQVLEAGHLFPAEITYLAFRRNNVFRDYMFEFIERLAPHLDRSLIYSAISMPSKKYRQALFEELVLPVL